MIIAARISRKDTTKNAYVQINSTHMQKNAQKNVFYLEEYNSLIMTEGHFQFW